LAIDSEIPPVVAPVDIAVDIVAVAVVAVDTVAVVAADIVVVFVELAVVSKKNKCLKQRRKENLSYIRIKLT